MDSSSAASTYKTASIHNAPPLKIIHMMYEGALRFIKEAQNLDPVVQHEAYQEKINRADAVVCELRLSLDHAEAPDVSGQLTSLYLFVEDQLRQALVERSIEPLQPAADVLNTLLEGWRQIDADARRASA